MQNPLTIVNNATKQAESQDTLGELASYTPLSTELDEVFNCIPYQKLVKAMHDDKRKKAFSPLGRPNYSFETMLKAYLASYILPVKSTNDLIRRLQENPVLALVCGFNLGKPLPHRTTFNRFFNRLTKYQDLLDQIVNEVATKLHELIPDFGKVVAMDATPIHSHSHPNKNPVSDPEAGFVYKGGHEGKYNWEFGYYLHVVADTSSELPITKELSLASKREKEMAILLLKRAQNKLSWFKPEVVTADAGYDGHYVYETIVNEFDAEPIIDLAKGKEALLSGSSDKPICPAGFPLVRMGYTEQGIRYKCPARLGKVQCSLLKQCSLKVAYVRPGYDYRRFGYRIPRTSPRWQQLYNKRTAIERIFSRLKDKRRLNSHCFRGFRKINLHCTLSILVMQAMALAKVQSGQFEEIRVCARKIA